MKKERKTKQLTSSETSPWAIGAHLWPGIRSHSIQIVFATVAMLSGVLLRLIEPWPLQIVLDNVVGGVPASASITNTVDWLSRVTESSPLLVLLTLCALCLILLAVARGGIDYYRTVAFAQIGNSIVSNLRGRLYSHLQTLSLNFHSRTRSGDITVRLTGDVNMLKDVTVSAALPMLSSGLLLVGMLGVMLWINWQLGLVVLAALPFFAWITIRSSRNIHLSARKQRKREGALASAAAETLSAVKSFQAHGIDSSVNSAFNDANKKSHKEGARTSRLMAGLERTVDVQIAVVTAIILWMGARLVVNHELTTGEMVVYLAYLKRGFKPLQDFAKYTGRFSKAIAAGERISELLETKADIVDCKNAVVAPPFRGSITFNEIGFGYNRTSGNGNHSHRPVYEKFTAHIEAGSCTAIVGPSGIGKSTLFSLLLRLHDVDKGSVLIDGEDIRKWTLQSLRRQMTVILQENSIFGATVRENIGMFCPSASNEEIVAAAKTACAHEFIESMDEGYESMLGERGVDLSQGQIQRIAIARAALKNSPILLLDEPTSNLDAANKAKVLSALHQVSARRTTLIITHDLDLAQSCDRVLYLGKQFESAFDTHPKLLNACPSYARLWETTAADSHRQLESTGAVR